LFDAVPDESGSLRGFVGAAALAVGLLTGFAGGYITGQRNSFAPTPVPRVPAREAAPVELPREVPAQSYTEAPVAEAVAPAATVEVASPRAPRAPMPRQTSMTSAASTSPTGALLVVSRPSGAEVFLDERLVGTTPLSLSDVATGTHAVQITLPGHQRWTTAVTVSGGESARVAASLEP
jgi:hypothetical protein